MNKNILAVFLTAAVFIISCTKNKTDHKNTDLYFENGTIYTADARDSIAEALAVKNGIIIYAGPAKEGLKYRKKAKETVDLEGYMLLPGLIDGHIHSVTPEMFDFFLSDITDLTSMMEAIQGGIEADPDKKAYFGFGYMPSFFEGEEQIKGPKKERLDAICPDKPVIIYSFDGHSIWLNNKGFEYSGITKDTENTPGGEIVKDSDGGLWGTLLDTAMSLAAPIPADLGITAPAMLDFQHSLNSLGYTSIMTVPGNNFFPVPFEAYSALDKQDVLTLRVRGAGIVSSWDTAHDLAALAKLKEQYNSGLLRVTGAKLFLDGVVDTETAYLLEPYADSTNYGSAVWTQKDLNAAVAAVNSMGLQAHAHALGDGAVRMFLDAAEYAKTKAPAGDYRNTATHLQLVAPGDTARFKTLGVIANTQPFWHFKEPSYWEPVEHKNLGERANKEYPVRSFLKNGVMLSFSSDYPVTVPPNPFVGLEVAVTRNMPGITDINDPRYLLRPEERLSVTEALRAYTINAAYAIFAEEVTGSLEAGKSADMTVIDRNLFTVEPSQISGTVVLRTYFQGKAVYDAGE